MNARITNGTTQIPVLKTAITRVFNVLSRLLARQPTWNRCDACGQPAQFVFLVLSPFGFSRNCDRCRDAWSHAVRRYYATRTATVITAQPAPLRNTVP